MGGACARHGIDKKGVQYFGWKICKRPRARPRRKWQDNIRINLREIGWERVDWIHRAQDRDRWRAVVNTAMNPRIP
jgi:hypothetical protein